MADEQASNPDPTDAAAPAGETGDAVVSQAEIDAVMAAMNEAAPAVDAAAGDASAEPSLDSMSIDDLLKAASFEDASAVQSPGAVAVPTQEFALPNFQEVLQDAQVSSIDLLRDVELNVKIELGRSRMLVEDVLKLGEGSVVELDKLAGDPVDVFVNNRLVARGEVLVLNDNFCVRVNEIVAGAKEEMA
jgi:flagellar motor switch protein FliN/FliY